LTLPHKIRARATIKLTVGEKQPDYSSLADILFSNIANFERANCTMPEMCNCRKMKTRYRSKEKESTWADLPPNNVENLSENSMASNFGIDTLTVTQFYAILW
jgi:hypothetical protein